MSVNLAIELADGTVETLTVDVQGPVSIGRDPSCHVVLPSPDVSRRHLMVQASNGAFLITDNSANGTMVGDQRVRGTTVQVPGNLPMRVGPYVIRVVDPHSPAYHPAASQHAAPGAYAQPAPGAYGQPPAAPGAYGQPGYPAQAGPSSAAVAPQSAYPQPAYSPPRPPPGGGFPAQQAGPYQQPARPVPSAAPPKKTGEASPYDQSGTSMVSVELRKRIHKLLLENLDLASLDRNKMDDRVMRPKVRTALRRIIGELKNDLPATCDTSALIDEIADEALGLGPLERLIADEAVSEIMVVDPTTIYVERKGKIALTALRFTDDEAVRAVIERIVTPLGRRIDESTPLVDARLKDGSRVNAVIRPLAIKGSCITIRKFAKVPLMMGDLIKFGAMTDQMGRFLTRCVKSRRNIVISGGTGSGKTTLLNVLSASIPEDERIVTIEDAAELQMKQPHVVSLETRPANMEGRGEYSIRDLVKNSLRMRPDRIIVGECRSGEALDMLQAMNTGHEGSMTTTHANTPREAISRLETLALMSGLDLPARAIRDQIASAVHVVIQQSRLSDGTRKVTSITEIVGIDADGDVELHEIFGFFRTGTGPGGKVVGEFRASGYLPSFIEDFITQGLVTDGDFL